MISVEEDAQRLTALGYRRISNKFRMVSRIDRPDWVYVMAEDQMRAPADFYVPGESHPSNSWADHYRRVYSSDKIEGVSADVFKLIPGSGDDHCGYVSMGGAAFDEPLVTDPLVITADWLPTAANTNALPYPLRKYVNDLATNCDPSGMVRENTLMKDQVFQMQNMMKDMEKGVWVYGDKVDTYWLWVFLFYLVVVILT